MDMFNVGNRVRVVWGTFKDQYGKVTKVDGDTMEILLNDGIKVYFYRTDIVDGLIVRA